MKRRKIGVMVDSFRLPIRSGVEKVSQLGADGFQVYVTSGEMEPTNLVGPKRKDFVKLVRSLGLEVSALCGDLGKGFLTPATNPAAVAKSKEFVNLAVDLETRIITTHIGYLPHDENAPEWREGVKAVTEVARYAEKHGIFFASETGGESAEVLLRFLRKIDSAGMKVNYDPANLVMRGFDHLGGVEVLRDYIVHTHAKDGVRHPDGRGEEVPLGQGKVDFPKYLARLDAVGYKGYLTIEREVGDDPVGEIGTAVRFLRKL